MRLLLDVPPKDKRYARFATIDHVIPWSEGGSHDPENLVLACHRCNQARAKGKDVTDPRWRQTTCIECGKTAKKIKDIEFLCGKCYQKSIGVMEMAAIMGVLPGEW